MDLDDLFGPEPRAVNLRAENRWQAIDELLNHLVATTAIDAAHQDAITAAVKKREHSMSTGIGFGIGLPHAATNLVSRVVCVVGRSRIGVQFDSLDGKPVTLVILFLVPEGEFQKHLHTLANIAKLVHRADFRDGLWGRFD